MSIAGVRTQLETIMNELVGGGQPLVAVYDYFEPKPDQYPVAHIIVRPGIKEPPLDSASNLLVTRFSIIVTFETENNSAIEDLKIAVCDQIMAKFRTEANYATLGGIVQKVEILDVSPLATNENAEAFIGFDILIEASIIKAIT